MSILNAVMVPHPPLIIPQVGRGEEKAIRSTIDAYEQAARFVADAKPDTIVVLSPHTVLYYDYFHISPGAGAEGDFRSFGAGNVRLSVRYDEDFVLALSRRAVRQGFPAGTEGEKSAQLDHGAMIPLWFLQRAYGGAPLPPVVRIGLSGFPLADHYKLGMLIRQTAKELDRRVCVVASGDLSHRLKPDGPYGFRSEGPEYDRKIMDVMGRGDFGALFSFGDSFCEKAGECGHRSFTIMAGCFDGVDVKAEALSHEGPFGVGYGVCLFTPLGEDPARRFLAREQEREYEEMERLRRREDPYVRLARLSVETFVRTGGEAALPHGLPEELLARRAGAFVSLHVAGRLRGCIGTTAPTEPSLAREILRNGISACSRDPRFPPVREEELVRLVYSVDVLGPAEPIDSPAALDVRKYGVIVSHGPRRGLLLPDLDGVDTVEQQISIAREKGGIAPDEDVKLQRFEVVRHV